MESIFCPYEQALSLNELGFDEPCFMIYYDGTNELRGSIHFLYSRDIKAPLYQQAFRWFRSKYSICVEIHQTTDWEEDNESWSFVIFKYRLGNNDGMVNSIIDYDTYEEAELACLDKLIDIVKNKKIFR